MRADLAQPFAPNRLRLDAVTCRLGGRATSAKAGPRSSEGTTSEPARRGTQTVMRALISTGRTRVPATYTGSSVDLPVCGSGPTSRSNVVRVPAELDTGLVSERAPHRYPQPRTPSVDDGSRRVPVQLQPTRHTPPQRSSGRGRRPARDGGRSQDGGVKKRGAAEPSPSIGLLTSRGGRSAWPGFAPYGKPAPTSWSVVPRGTSGARTDETMFVPRGTSRAGAIASSSFHVEHHALVRVTP